MRWLLLLLIACKKTEAPPPPPPSPTPSVAPIDASIDASIDAAIPKTLRSALAVDVTVAKRLVVTADAVTIDDKPVDLAKLKLPKPGDVWHAPPGDVRTAQHAEADGTLWVRQTALKNRPLLVVEGDLPAIRFFEVAGAVRPGVALEVMEGDKPRAFGYRAYDAADDDITMINDPVEIEVDYEGISVTGASGNRKLGTDATVETLRTAVLAVAPSQNAELKWGFVTFEGAKLPTALVVTTLEALAAADIAGVNFIVGRSDVPRIAIASGDLVGRRFVKQRSPKLLECYRQHLADGHLEITFADKKFQALKHTGIDDNVAACMTDNLKDIALPKADRITVTIDLESQGGFR